MLCLIVFHIDNKIIMKKMVISVNGKKYDVEVEVIDDGEDVQQSQQFYNPSLFRAENYGIQNPESDTVIIARPSTPVTPKNSQGSPVNGKVMEIYVKVGDMVQERDKIMALETMKMKTNIYSAKTGKIAKILVNIGDPVDQNQTLCEFE